MDASQQDDPNPGPAARGRTGPGAPAGGAHAAHGRRAARKQQDPEQQPTGQGAAQAGHDPAQSSAQASAFRRALDAQAETTGLVPSAPHDLTQPIPRVRISEDEFSFPITPPDPAAAETRVIGGAPDALAPPSRVPAWLPPVHPADRARFDERGFPAGPVAPTGLPGQPASEMQQLAPTPFMAPQYMPQQSMTADTASMQAVTPQYMPPQQYMAPRFAAFEPAEMPTEIRSAVHAAPMADPSGDLVVAPSKAATMAEAPTAVIKPPPGFAAVPTAPSPRHSGRSRRDRVLLLVGASVALAVLLGVGLMLVNGGTPMNPMAPSALPSAADPSQHALIAGAGPSGSASPSASASASASASPSASASASQIAMASPSASAAASTQPAAPPPSPSAARTSSAPTGTKSQQPGCSVNFSVSGWSSGYQMSFTVTSTGTKTTSDWSVSFVLPSRQTASEVWDAQAEQIGRTVEASSDSYNGQLAPGDTATWGMIISGGGQPVSAGSSSTELTCSAQ